MKNFKSTQRISVFKHFIGEGQVKRMKAEILESYVEKVYGYAVNHTYSRDEADELSQEILFTAIRELPKLKDDRKFEPWLWGVANHVTQSFRRFMGKNRVLYYYDFLENTPFELPDGQEQEEQQEREERYDFLRRKIAMLSEIYRSVVILYYYDALSVKAIAEKLHIPEGTVTWRLSEARKKIKKEYGDMSETILRPVHMKLDIYGSGDYDGIKKPFPTVYIEDALSKNMMYHAYEKPCTIEDLAKLCGACAYYIEDRMENLVKREAMVEMSRGKYQTGFVIWSDRHGIYCEENAQKALMPVMNKLISALKEISKQAMQLDFYKAGKSEEDLFYLLGALAFLYADRKYCPLPYPSIPRRYDGNTWCYLGNMESGKHRRVGMGLQRSLNVGGRGSYCHMSFGHVPGMVFRPMMLSEYINVCEDILQNSTTGDIDSAANAIRDGYIIRKEDGMLFVTAPAFTTAQAQAFHGIVEEYLAPYMDEYSQIVCSFVAGYKKLFPKHLGEDADRLCRNVFTDLFCVVAAYGQMTRQIAMPSKNCCCDVLWQYK